MDFKKVLKTIFIAVVVPGGSAVIAYYSVQYSKKKYDDWMKSKKDIETKQSN